MEIKIGNYFINTYSNDILRMARIAWPMLIYLKLEKGFYLLLVVVNKVSLLSVMP